MPISKYNPDGTVDIYNRKTGEVRRGIAPEQLGQISPNLVAEYYEGQQPQEQLARAEAEQKLQTMQTGGGDPQTQQDLFNLIGGLPTGSERESARDAIKFYRQISDAQSAFGQAQEGGLPGASGPITNMLAGVAEKAGFDPAELQLRDSLTDIVQQIRKERTGVQFSEKEQEELETIFGSLKAQEEPLERRLEKLGNTTINEISLKTGLSRQQIEKLLNEVGVEEGAVMSTPPSFTGDVQTSDRFSEFADIPADEAVNEFLGKKKDTGASDEAIFELTGEQAPSLSGLGENALNDVREMVEGVMQIPSLIGTLIENPSLAPEVGKSIVIGTIDEYKRLLTQPLEEAYGHPVNTVLNVIPFIPLGKAGFTKFLSKADDAGDVAKATSVATKAIDETGDVAKSAQVATGALDDVATSVDDVGAVAKKSGLFPSRAEIASKTYSTAFTIPTKRARQLKPQIVSSKMLDYGVTGGFEDLRTAANTITGGDGVLSKMVRDSLGSIKGEVDVSDAITQAEKSASRIATLNRGARNQIVKIVSDTIPTGQLPNTVNPLDAYDAAKNLEQLGHQYLNSSTYLTKNIEAEQIGNAYLAAANEIMSKLDKTVSTQGIVSSVKTPENLAKIAEVSPKLAEEVRAASTVPQLRSLQAPFVRLNQMIDLTEDAANSAFSGVSRGVVSRTPMTTGMGVLGATVGSPFGIPGSAALGTLGMGAGYVMSPAIEAVMQSIQPKALTNFAKFIN